MNKLLLPLMLLAGVASAQIEDIDYIGGSLTSITWSGATTQPYPNLTAIDAELSLDGPLPQNGTVTISTDNPTSNIYLSDFSIDGTPLNSGGLVGGAASGALTFVNGVISDALFSATYYPIDKEPYGVYIYDTSQPLTVSISAQGATYLQVAPGSFIYTASSSSSGSWVVSPPINAAPELDANSALAALTLLAGGVLIMRPAFPGRMHIG